MTSYHHQQQATCFIPSWRTLYLTSFCRSDRIFVCCLRSALSFWWETPVPWVRFWDHWLLRSRRFWVSQSRSLRSWWSRVYDSVWWAQTHPCQSWFLQIYSKPSANKWSKQSQRRSLIWLSDRKNTLLLKAPVLQALGWRTICNNAVWLTWMFVDFSTFVKNPSLREVYNFPPDLVPRSFWDLKRLV